MTRAIPTEDPSRLDHAARQLQQLSKRLGEIANQLHEYQSVVSPIADGVNSLVGGSSTRRDVKIGQEVQAAAATLKESIGYVTAAMKLASDAASNAHLKADQVRRQQAHRHAAPNRAKA